MPSQESIEQAEYIFHSILTLREYFSRQYMRCIAALHESSSLSGLSLAQAQAIHGIYNRGKVTLTELARMQKVSAPSASAMVDRLVEKGILLREQDTEDRRKVAIRVSPGVAADFSELQSLVLASFVELVEKIGPDTASQWCRVLRNISSVLAAE